MSLPPRSPPQIGIFTMPLWLKALYSGTSFDLSIDMVALLVNLLITVLVPSLLGKALRELVPAVRAFVTKHKTPLSLFSTANLAFIVWQVLSSAQSVRECPACTRRRRCPRTASGRKAGWRASGVQPAPRNPHIGLLHATAAVMDQPFVSIVYVLLLSAAQHIIYLAFNFAVTT
jgi:sodium/bile acid cotransporter 7